MLNVFLKYEDLKDLSKDPIWLKYHNARHAIASTGLGNNEKLKLINLLNDLYEQEKGV